MVILIAIGILLIVWIRTYLPFFNKKKELNDMEKQAGYLIKKVELYKTKYHKYPKYMADMNLDLPDDYPFSYAIQKDSTSYVVGFEIGPFKSMVYYSDTKEWIPQQ